MELTAQQERRIIEALIDPDDECENCNDDFGHDFDAEDICRKCGLDGRGTDA